MQMAPVVALPTGNVAVVPTGAREVKVELPRQARADDDPGRATGPAAEDDRPTGWSIRSGSGEVVRSGLPDRATAARMLGVLAAHGAELPLAIYGPEGRPTGERLG
jgi:hypothetical protein